MLHFSGLLTECRSELLELDWAQKRHQLAPEGTEEKHFNVTPETKEFYLKGTLSSTCFLFTHPQGLCSTRVSYLNSDSPGTCLLCPSTRFHGAGRASTEHSFLLQAVTNDTGPSLTLLVVHMTSCLPCPFFIQMAAAGILE